MNLLKCLLSSLLGLFALFCYALNLIFWGTLTSIAGILMRSFPQHFFFRETVERCSEGYAYTLLFLFKQITPTEIIIDDISFLSKKKWYLLISNHQSWIDILLLDAFFIPKIPVLKFFLKKELLWFPMVGLICWALEFPFMERVKKSDLKKDPKKKGKDRKTTRVTCEKCQQYPSTIANFLEGTRYSQRKKILQNSPYQNLLRPKAAGMALALESLKGKLETILNITLIYDKESITAWDFFCGRIKKIIIKVDTFPIEEQWYGSYETDSNYRKEFHRFVSRLWEEKDQRIEKQKGTIRSV